MRKLLLLAVPTLALWISTSTPAWGIGYCADLCSATSSCSLQCIDPSENWSTCGGYGICQSEPVSEEIVIEDPECPEGVSCYIQPIDYDVLCLEQGFGRHSGYIGHTKFRAFKRTIVICWWWV